MEDIKLTNYSKYSGWGAKLSPEVLDKALCGLEQPIYPNLMIDYSNAEDAGVYQINDELALVQTLDFFPPIVDEPYIFGQISACNALSDIYAMGGTPKTAMSIVCFPDDTVDIGVLREIMNGALSKLIEAKTALLGGHSISDTEIKFGLSVSGFVNPKKMLTNNTPRKGDVIIVTKPVGSGVINTLLKVDLATKEMIASSNKYMTQLNKVASEIIMKHDISCGTDITGFGLLGHLVEVVQRTEVGAEIVFDKVRLMADIMEFIEMGMVPAGTYNNKNYRKGFIDNLSEVAVEKLDVLFDPQTSGGLMVGVAAEEAENLLNELNLAGIDAFSCGTFTDNKGKIRIV